MDGRRSGVGSRCGRRCAPKSFIYQPASSDYIAIKYDFYWPDPAEGARYGHGIVIHRGLIRWHDVHHLPRGQDVRARLLEGADHFGRLVAWVPLSLHNPAGPGGHRRTLKKPDICPGCFIALSATGVCSNS